MNSLKEASIPWCVWCDVLFSAFGSLSYNFILLWINQINYIDMIVQFMIDEVEGILILLGRKPEPKVLTAIESLPAEDIKGYRDSLAQEWKVLNPSKDLLLVD